MSINVTTKHCGVCDRKKTLTYHFTLRDRTDDHAYEIQMRELTNRDKYTWRHSAAPQKQKFQCSTEMKKCRLNESVQRIVEGKGSMKTDHTEWVLAGRVSDIGNDKINN